MRSHTHPIGVLALLELDGRAMAVVLTTVVSVASTVVPSVVPLVVPLVVHGSTEHSPTATSISPRFALVAAAHSSAHTHAVVATALSLHVTASTTGCGSGVRSAIAGVHVREQVLGGEGLGHCLEHILRQPSAACTPPCVSKFTFNESMNLRLYTRRSSAEKGNGGYEMGLSPSSSLISPSLLSSSASAPCGLLGVAAESAACFASLAASSALALAAAAAAFLALAASGHDEFSNDNRHKRSGLSQHVPRSLLAFSRCLLICA